MNNMFEFLRYKIANFSILIYKNVMQNSQHKMSRFLFINSKYIAIIFQQSLVIELFRE